MAKPIRILHVVDNLARGGLQNGLLNLIERLSAEQFEHVICSVRALDENAARFHPERVRVLCLDKKDTAFPFQAGWLARVVREVRPDIVHSRNWAAIEAVIAARWVGACAVVHSEHGLESQAHIQEPWRRRCFRRLAFELADQVLSVSYQLRDLHATRTGFAARRIAVIHNGVDHHRFAPNAAARAHVRGQLRIAEHEFCIGCVGNLTRVKDYLTLLRALEEVAARHRDWRVVIAGEGPERAVLEDFLQAHPEWEQRVSLLGVRTEIAELLNAMDVYVLCSLTEGISNSLLEAMATGLPVVVTEVGGNPEVVVEGKSGMLFGVGDSRQLAERLLLLGQRSDLRLGLGREAQRRVRQEFSIHSMVQQYEQLYESLAPAVRPVERIAASA